MTTLQYGFPPDESDLYYVEQQAQADAYRMLREAVDLLGVDVCAVYVAARRSEP